MILLPPRPPLGSEMRDHLYTTARPCLELRYVEHVSARRPTWKVVSNRASSTCVRADNMGVGRCNGEIKTFSTLHAADGKAMCTTRMLCLLNRKHCCHDTAETESCGHYTLLKREAVATVESEKLLPLLRGETGTITLLLKRRCRSANATYHVVGHFLFLVCPEEPLQVLHSVLTTQKKTQQ